jgi:GNAT superfamily N-acetyltransferase
MGSGASNGMSSEDGGTRTRCHRNYAEAFWQFTKWAPGAARRNIGGGLAIRCDLPYSLANTWFLPEPEVPIDATFPAAAAFFGPRTPWRLISDGPPSGSARRAALAHGLAPITAEPGMLLDPIRTGAPAAPAVDIRTVGTLEDLQDFARVWCAAFGVPPFVFPLVLPRVLTDDADHRAQNRLFVGYAGGAPAACSAVVVTERVAGVVSVGTLTEARGRGLGTALTAHAVESGRSLGADVAYLAATPMGLPVYRRMGFRTVADYPSWATPVSLFRQLRSAWTTWRLARAFDRRR